MEKKQITRAKAEKIYKSYIATLYKLIAEEKNQFDLIIGPADSGTFMVESVKLFYKIVKRKSPKTLIIALQRFLTLGAGKGKHYDNSRLIPQLKTELKNLKQVKQVLFLDDEIMTAWTAKESVRLVLSALPKRAIPKRVNYTILAENHGFEWHYNLDPVAIKYYSFSKKITGVNGSIFEIVSEDTLKKFRKIDQTISKKQIASILTNGRLKVSENNTPKLSGDLTTKAKVDLPRYIYYQGNFKKYIERLIKQGIKDYKQGKIKLRD